jgi:hypothetical protein
MIISQNKLSLSKDSNITSFWSLCITKKWLESHTGIINSPDGSIEALLISSVRVNCKKKEIHPIMGLHKLRYNDKINQYRRRKWQIFLVTYCNENFHGFLGGTHAYEYLLCIIQINNVYPSISLCIIYIRFIKRQV